jgi:hypothetical protein
MKTLMLVLAMSFAAHAGAAVLECGRKGREGTFDVEYYLADGTLFFDFDGKAVANTDGPLAMRPSGRADMGGGSDPNLECKPIAALPEKIILPPQPPRDDIGWSAEWEGSGYVVRCIEDKEEPIGFLKHVILPDGRCDGGPKPSVDEATSCGTTGCRSL